MKTPSNLLKPSNLFIGGLMALEAAACAPGQSTETAEARSCHPQDQIAQIKESALGTLVTADNIINDPASYPVGYDGKLFKNDSGLTTTSVRCEYSQDFLKYSNFAYCNTTPDWHSYTAFTIEGLLYTKEGEKRSLDVTTQVTNHATGTVTYPRDITVTTENGECKIEYKHGSSPETELCPLLPPTLEECTEILDTIENIIKSHAKRIDEINGN